MARERIRVLHILQTTGIGGMERRVLRLARGLDPSLYEIHVISLRPTTGNTMAWPEGTHEYFPIDPGIHPSRLSTLGLRIRAGRYHIVHTHNWSTMFYGILAAKMARVPVVLHGEHGPNQDDWRGVSRKREMIASVLARLATRVVAVNEFISQDVTRRWKLPLEHVESIPNGVDLVRFSPRPKRMEQQADFVIGTIARMDRIKDLPCLIQAFDLFRSAHPQTRARLILVGSGPEFEHIGKLAAATASAEHIQFAGETERPEDWYARFDLYVNSSFSEGMSNTILEAMACGLPVVASAVNGNLCWLREGINALFFPSGDYAAIAERFARLAKNPVLARTIGNENHRRAEREYDNRQFIHRYHSLYQKLLGR